VPLFPQLCGLILEKKKVLMRYERRKKKRNGKRKKRGKFGETYREERREGREGREDRGRKRKGRRRPCFPHFVGSFWRRKKVLMRLRKEKRNGEKERERQMDREERREREERGERTQRKKKYGRGALFLHLCSFWRRKKFKWDEREIQKREEERRQISKYILKFWIYLNFTLPFFAKSQTTWEAGSIPIIQCHCVKYAKFCNRIV
jgi:hypothetical protein